MEIEDGLKITTCQEYNYLVRSKVRSNRNKQRGHRKANYIGKNKIACLNGIF